MQCIYVYVAEDEQILRNWIRRAKHSLQRRSADFQDIEVFHVRLAYVFAAGVSDIVSFYRAAIDNVWCCLVGQPGKVETGHVACIRNGAIRAERHGRRHGLQKEAPAHRSHAFAIVTFDSVVKNDLLRRRSFD
jgi:hypothetical protein